MRSRALVIAALVAALLPLGGLGVSTAAPSVAPHPVLELRMTTSGTCPPGTVRVPRESAKREYRRAHRFAVRTHLSKAQLRRLLLCATTTTAAVPTPAPAPSSPSAPSASSPAAVPSWQGDMVARINALRASVGAGPVALCAPIGEAAQGYAETMARTGVFAHTGTDGSQPWDRMRAAGYRWSRATENIAKGYGDVPAVMNGWIGSPGHYANLVDPRVVHVGLGLAVDAGGTRWWVQNFGAGGTC